MKFYYFKNNTCTLILILFLQITKARFVSETNREQINRETQDYFHERGLTFGDPDSIYDQNDMDLENDGTQYFPQPPIYNTFANANIQKPQLQLEPQLPKSNQIVQPLTPLQQLESQLKLQRLIQQQKEYEQFQKQYARELQQQHLHSPQGSNGLFLHQNLPKNEQNMLYRSPKKVLSLLKQNEQSNLLNKLSVNPEYHKIYDQKFMIHQPAPPLEHQPQLQAQPPLIQNPEPKILINVDSDNKQLQPNSKDSYIPHDKKSLYTDPNNFDLEVFSEEKLNPAHSALYNSFNQPKEGVKIQQPDILQNIIT